MSSITETTRRWFFRLVCGGVLFLSGAGVAAVRLGESGRWFEWIRGADEVADLPDSGRVLKVNTVIAEPTESYLTSRRLVGIVRTRRESELSFTRAGRIDRALARIGQTVRQGEPLFGLDEKLLKQQKKQLESRRDLAVQQLNQLTADPRAQSLAQLNARVLQLSAEVDRLRNETGTRGENQTRLQDASRTGQQLDSATRDPKVEAQRRVVDELEVEIAEIDQMIEQCTLVAPFDGTVARTDVVEGDSVAPGVAVARLVQPSELEVTFGLPSEFQDLADVAYTLRVDGEEYSSELASLSPELDPSSRTRSATFRIGPSESSEILPGAVAELVLRRRIDSEGYWLPLSALMHRPDCGWTVFVVEGGGSVIGSVAKRCVDVQDVQGDRARVRGVMDDGVAIIIDGTHRIVAGQCVDPSPVETRVGADGEASWR